MKQVAGKFRTYPVRGVPVPPSDLFGGFRLSCTYSHKIQVPGPCRGHDDEWTPHVDTYMDIPGLTVKSHGHTWSGWRVSPASSRGAAGTVLRSRFQCCISSLPSLGSRLLCHQLSHQPQTKSGLGTCLPAALATCRRRRECCQQCTRAGVCSGSSIPAQFGIHPALWYVPGNYDV